MSELPDYTDELNDDEFDKMLELEEMDEKLSKKLKVRQQIRDQQELERLRDELFVTGSEFSPVTRDDIVGIDNILNQVDDVIAWLKNPEAFMKWGARPEPGILLEGSPGTGKTLCSRYIASNSDALFLNVRDFATEREIIGPNDIADLFERCRSFYEDHKRPVVIFWDEFEVFARERERMGQSMRDSSVVSQLTAELDGVAGKAQGVLFIGCTNYKRLIDRALLRPGRMGMHIKFVAPDRHGKAHLLAHYLGKFNTSDALDYDSASYFFNEDDTAAAVEEAAQKVWMRAIIDATHTNREPVIEQETMSAVLLENLLGPPPPFMQLRPDSEFAVAVHELGHALVAYMLGVPILFITIQPGTDTFGRVMTHNVDKKISNVFDVRRQISIGLGSIVAENVVGIPNSAHAESDVRTSTQLASGLIDDLGQLHNGVWPGPMSIKGLNQRTAFVNGAISQDLVRTFDQRVGDVIRDAFHLSEEALHEVGEKVVIGLAERLLKDKTWTGKQFESMFQVCWHESNRPSDPKHDDKDIGKMLAFPQRWEPSD